MGDIILEGEVVDDEPRLPAVQAPAVTLFRSDEPQEIVERATAVADVLSKVLKDKNLTTTISGREHVRVEGWTFCGSMLGVFPVIVWSRPVDGGWEARSEAVTMTGAVIGAAEAQCLRAESKWKTRDDYALRSMAQTRAVSKALRAPLGFIVALAGFDATPEEEMPGSHREHEPQVLDPEGPKVPHTWADVERVVSEYGAGAVEDYKAFTKAAGEAVDSGAAKLAGTKLQAVRMVVTAIMDRFEPSAFPGPMAEDWQGEWAKVLGGVILEPGFTVAVDDKPSDAALTPDQQQALDDLAASKADSEIGFGVDPRE